MKFKTYLNESPDYGPAMTSIHTLRYGESVTVITQVANRLAKIWNVQVPTEIGQAVVFRQASPTSGSLTMTMAGKNKYIVTNHNNPLNPEMARKDIPYG